MAENARPPTTSVNSTSASAPPIAKGSSPKPVTQTDKDKGPEDQSAGLSKVIGARILVTNASEHAPQYEATLLHADPRLNLITVSTKLPPPSTSTTAHNLHIIPISQIASFEVLGLAGDNKSGPGNFTDAEPQIGPIDLKQAKKRERDAIARVKEQDAKRGKGVGPQGQSIFDALDRLLPSRWNGTSIVVNDSVIIDKPYNLENCSAPKDKQPALVQVRKMLENEWRKMAERSRMVSTPSRDGRDGKESVGGTSPAVSGSMGQAPLPTGSSPRKGG